MRSFNTGATRSADAHRDDPEGFLSPLVIDRFNQYMSKHRKQADGTLRDSDNWQKGMPLTTYMKGLWRHFLHLWTRHRGYEVRDAGAAVDIEEDCCSIMFNVMGYLHETIKARLERERIEREGSLMIQPETDWSGDLGSSIPFTLEPGTEINLGNGCYLGREAEEVDPVVEAARNGKDAACHALRQNYGIGG